ncbi:MAG: PQQ-dependent sugar dehydrogenase [Acidimicrobiales bacterium]
MAVALAAVFAACGPSAAGPGSPPPEPLLTTLSAHHFDVERVASGLDRPTWVGAAPGDPGALWALEQAGRVVRVEGGRPQVALDLSGDVGAGTEAGMLGIAFHPGFAANGRLFLHWNDREGDTRVAELAAAPDRRAIGRRPVRELLFVAQPAENHNGGQLAFGPDGRLYIGLGDGGLAFDPDETAQDPRSPLGKVVAVDVDAARPRWEAVLVGLRNPWRFSFDPALSEVWVADVGQDQVEEVNRVRLEPDEPPKNLGWSAYEGRRELPQGHRLRGEGDLVSPVVTYGHDEGCAVIGGLVYTGVALPEMARRYLFGDFCSGALWSLRPKPGRGVTDVRREAAKVPQLTHIGTDADGELVFASAAGSLFRAVPAGG